MNDRGVCGGDEREIFWCFSSSGSHLVEVCLSELLLRGVGDLTGGVSVEENTR